MCDGTGRTAGALETLGAVGLMEARRLRDEFAVEVRQQQTPRAARTMRLAETAADWLEIQRHRVDVDQLSQRSYDGCESALRLHCLPALGHRHVGSITPDHLVGWHRQHLGLIWADVDFPGHQLRVSF